MKFCPNCGAQLADDAVFCANCGTNLGSAPVPPEQPQPQYVPPYAPPQYVPQVDPHDHTAEFDAKDISENKVIAMLVYLLDVVGIIIALLAANTSPYAAFHVRQALKFSVVQILVGFISVLLCWTVIVPIAGVIFMGVLFVIKIICFFQICGGKAKEPAIIRSLPFLH